MKPHQRVHVTIGTSNAHDAREAGVQAARAALHQADRDTLVAALVVAAASTDAEAARRGVREVMGNTPVLATSAASGAKVITPDMVCVYLLAGGSSLTGAPRESESDEGVAMPGKVDAVVDTLWAILDTLPLGIFWQDRKGKYLGCNKRFARHAGLKSPADVVGCTDCDFSWAEYAEYYAQVDQEVMATGRSKVNFVEPVVRADGSRVWIRTSKFPLRDAMGRIIGFIGAYEDINELRAALGEIAEGENNYREMFNASNDAMLIISSSASIVDANERACELFGYSRDELLRMSVPDLGYGEPPYSATDAIERISSVTPGESQRFEWLHRHRSGEPLWVDVSLRLAKIAGRECVIASMRDITLRKEMEEELRKSRERYMAYFQMLPDAAGISRASNGELIEINQAFVDMFGWNREEALGKTSVDLGLWVNLKDRTELVELAGKSSLGAQQEYAFRNAKGEIGIALFCLRVFEEDGERYLYFICKDVTQRRRATDALREQAESLQMANMQLEVQSQHLRAQQEDLMTANRELEVSMHAAQAASRAKSEFLTTMSHELLTPLTAILGYAEQLGSGGGPCDDPDRATAIETIMRNGQQLTGILKSILDLSKIDAGEFKVEPSLCSPNQILDEVHEVLRLKAADKHLALSTKVEGTFPSSVETDPTRLRQVVMHLVDNAVKFTERGEISVAARINHRADGRPLLEVEVRDTGVGMTKEVVGRLFQPFSQADMSYTRQFQGTGMGLSICKRVCQLLGGDIAVSSTPGRGSTFVASFAVDIPANALPIHPAPAAAASSEQVAADALSCRVLLAEDSVDNQRLFSVFLKKAGATIEVVDDGQKAIESIAAAEAAGEPFDVILMDMQMPVLDGYEATKRLREAGFTRPILAVTAHGMVGDREKCIEAGCTDYVTKPIKRDTLITAVRTLLQQAKEDSHSMR